MALIFAIFACCAIPSAPVAGRFANWLPFGFMRLPEFYCGGRLTGAVSLFAELKKEFKRPLPSAGVLEGKGRGARCSICVGASLVTGKASADALVARIMRILRYCIFNCPFTNTVQVEISIRCAREI